MNNGKVRLLSGVEDIVQQPYGSSRIPYGSNDHELLERAMANIESHFGTIGVLERFDDRVKASWRSWGLPLSTRPRKKKNVGERHYDKIVPSSDELKLIKEYNQLDIEL